MQYVTLPRITELNPHLLCVLCGGYYIDATAIIECLHAFCKSCIVRYLETHRYCPICDVLVHKTEPLQNIRPDHIRQSIVYKLVPDLYKREMCNRRNFYVSIHSQLRPQNKELKGEITEESKFFSSDDTINLCIEYVNPIGDENYCFIASSGKRYLRCQASVTIKNLRKLIAAKYALELNHEIRFFLEGNQLPEHFKLLDIAYISSWKRIGYIRVQFEILIVGREVVAIERKELLPTPFITSSSDVSKVSQPAADIQNTRTISKNTSINKTPVHITESVSLAKPNLSDLNQSTVEKLRPLLNVAQTEILSVTNVPVVTTLLRGNAVNTTSVSVVKAPIVVSSISNSVVCDDSSVARGTNAKQLVISPASTNPVVCKAKNTRVTIATTNGKPTTVKSVESKTKNYVESNVKPKRAHESANIVPLDTPARAKTPGKPKETCPVPAKVAKLTNGIDAISMSSNMNDQSPKPVLPLIKASPSTNNVTPTSNTPTTSCPSSNIKTIPMKSCTSTVVVPYAVVNEMKLQRDSPRPIFSRSDPSPMIRTTTKTSKLMTRPWTTTASTSPVTPKPIIEGKEKREPTKIVKTRNTPRFLGAPSSGIRPMYQIVQNANSETKNDELKKQLTKNVSVLRVDPKTLSPISTSSSPETSSPASTSASNVSKKPFTYTAPTSKSFPNPNMYLTRSEALHFPPSIMPAKLPHYMYPYHCEPGSLQQINQLMQRVMYPNFNVSPEDVAKNLLKTKASASGIYGSSTYNPPLLMPFFRPSLKQPKYEKNQLKASPKSFPPAVQRIPPSNNNTTKVAGNEHPLEKKPLPSDAKHDIVTNGQIKSKCKKTTEMSNFSINNLIPLNETKSVSVSHTCDADGVNKLCDQVPSSTDGKNTNNTDQNTKAINEIKKKDFYANNS